ncbi:MAG: hypothetical protein HWN68_04480 [Desulfobacterales bacterium]|nr:hypothetical protein [Desulfobacterales bacterium]
MAEDSARLKALRRGLAVAEREIKDNESEIFLVHKKRTEMDETSSILLKEVESREAELRELSNSKGMLTTDIKNIESDIKQTCDAASAFAVEKHELSSGLEEMEAEESKLSEDISRIVSKASLDRDKIDNISIALFDSIAERDRLKQRLSAQDATINETPAAISGLEKKVALLEEVKVLQGERRILKADVEEQERESVALSEILKELKKVLSDKEEKLDRLSTENAERKYSVDSLEKDVMVYDEAVSALDQARERWKKSSGSAEQARGVLEKLLVDKARMEEELGTAMEKATSIADIMRSVFNPDEPEQKSA